MSRVYFVEAGKRGPIKIGTAIDVAARIHDLQAANPKRLSLIATLPGDHAYEHELHRHFHRERIHREWFRGNGEVRKLAEQVRANPSMDPPRFEPPRLPRRPYRRLREYEHRREQERLQEREQRRRYSVEELRAMFYVGEGSDIYRSPEAEKELLHQEELMRGAPRRR